MLIITRMAQQCSARVWSTVRHTCSAPDEATVASYSFSKHRDKTHSLQGRSSTRPTSACCARQLYGGRVDLPRTMYDMVEYHSLGPPVGFQPSCTVPPLHYKREGTCNVRTQARSALDHKLNLSSIHALHLVYNLNHKLTQAYKLTSSHTHSWAFQRFISSTIYTTHSGRRFYALTAAEPL